MGSIVVVRHGQASMYAADYDQLSERGVAQGQALGQFWAARGATFDAVLCGPARRHVGTEAAVAKVMRAAGHSWPDVSVVPELDEHDSFALVEGALANLGDDPEISALTTALAEATDRRSRGAGFQRVFEAVMKRWLVGGVEVEGIETWPAFRDRVLEGLEKLRVACRGGRRVVAFSSVGPVAVLLGRALATADEVAFETAWRLHNSGVSRFVSSKDRFTLHGYNDVGHLPDPQDHTFR